MQHPWMQLTLGWLIAVTGSASPLHAAETQPNILWINAEDMSPHLGCYGHPDAMTPNIDTLAAQGVVYKNAFATAPICSPARSCLATGLYATSLGTQHLRCEVQIPRQVVPLANRLKSLGYFCTNTGKSDYNFNPEGIWDAWNQDPAPWRARKPGQPFFSFITVGETHEGPTNFIDRYQRATAGLTAEQKHDPAKVQVPPFYPDTPEIRAIFARMHDLATVFDQKVGKVIEQLKADGDLQNTIVFIFGDHGNGLPRYKRWLNDSGLRVPLVVYVPPRFKQLCPHALGSQTGRLVSFVDFPATAISLAGGDVPRILQGSAFLGQAIGKPRQLVFGARSRADDMFEVSRSVFDGRFLYVRHFLPHLPYIQNSVIFDDKKSSYRELRRLHLAGELNEHAERLWADRKPREELYDLQNDPHELHNLANSSEVAETKQALRQELVRWILEHRDSGFLPEAEYQIRAAKAGLTPFEIVQDPKRFDLPATLQAAELVGDDTVDIQEITNGLNHREAGVRYWSVLALQARHRLGPAEISALAKRLADESPSVRIAAAETLLAGSDLPQELTQTAFNALRDGVQDERPWLALQAARSLAMLGDKAKSMVPLMKQVIAANLAEPGSRRVYRDFNYASFKCWALETALLQCGQAEYVEAINR